MIKEILDANQEVRESEMTPMTPQDETQPCADCVESQATDAKAQSDHILTLYQKLLAHFGDPQWWPAASREEMIIGAILVQNVSWKNTEKALQLVREKFGFTFLALREAPIEELAACVRSTRFYQSKAARLKAFAFWIEAQCKDNLDQLFARDLTELRRLLLLAPGIGPETADDILLYAANQPSFVIDTYTKRIMRRVGIGPERDSYEAWRAYFMERLPPDALLYNRYHALIDRLGNQLCRVKDPLCSDCPLKDCCVHARAKSLLD